MGPESVMGLGSVLGLGSMLGLLGGGRGLHRFYLFEVVVAKRLTA